MRVTRCHIKCIFLPTITRWQIVLHSDVVQQLCQKARYVLHASIPNEEWDEFADIMMINFSENGHPVFRGSSAFERMDL